MAPVRELPLLEKVDEERTRGVGILSVTRAEKKVALPLAGVRVAARVADRIASVTVTETFKNPYPEHLEAVYIFPLAGGSAVSDFELKVAGRTIKGKVEERGEARRQYRQALDQGKRAALLEQERDDVFTVQVGNLPPGEEVAVTITYSERLPFFEDGTTELRLPLVVAPRYIPGAPLDRPAVGEGVELDTDQVPDASRITPPRLAPGFDPKVALAIEVELTQDGAAATLEDLRCSQHATTLGVAAGGLKVALARQDELLNRDFVLRWRLAGAALTTSCLVCRDATGRSYGMVSILPPRREGFLGTARDVVFVVDRSGSMGGVKMASAARACSILLATLGPRDRFAIQAFDSVTEWFADRKFVAADEAGIVRGDKYLREIDARGGTEMDAAMADALALVRARTDGAGRIPVVVFITDGEVGNESQILKRIQTELGDARVFTVGIDTAVNDGFLKRLAALGGGTSTFVVPGAALEDALGAVGREIGAPLVVDVKIEGVDALAPARVPDLFAGRATTAFFAGRADGTVRVRGRFTDGAVFDEKLTPREVALPAIAHLWARARVADLEDRFRLQPAKQDEIKKEIVELAVRHTLLTRFTAFVVVDESEVVNKDGGRRTVTQPVETPDRWEMGTACGSVAATGRAFANLAMPCAPPPPPCPAPASASPDDTGEMAFEDNDASGTAAGEPLRCEEAALADLDDEPKAPGAPGGGLRGALGRALEAFGKKKKKGAPPPAPAPSKPAPKQEEAKRDRGPARAPAVPAAEREAIAKALAALVQAVADARTALAAGRVPPADALEKARANLLKALAASDLGQRLPALQRFLRAAAVELVAALRTPGIAAAALTPLFERHAKALDDARREAEPQLSGKGGGPGAGGNFWEGSV